MKKFSILVVDDDPDFLGGIIRHLKKEFTQIAIIGNASGEEAITTLKTREIGVLLTDLRMPGMSGHDLLLKGLEINPHLCVIMITGFATIENAVKAI